MPLIMMFLDEEQDASHHSRAKTLVLANRCGWLQRLLAQQDRLLALCDVLVASPGAGAWKLQAGLLREAVERQFRLEEMVLAAAIDRLGVRAHAVVADSSRRRLRHEIDALYALSWRDGRLPAERLRHALSAHFSEEESCSFRPLARQLPDDANDALTLRCQAAVREVR